MAEPVLGAVWAQTQDGVIGRGGDMPWYAPEDLAHFKAVTLGSPVVMGRATWDSFPPRFRPLPGRTNVVISRSVVTPVEQDGALWVPSLDAALRTAVAEAPGTVWVVGGGSVYEQALARTDLPGVAGGRVSRVERTVFEVQVPGDTSAPALGEEWTLVSCTPGAVSERGYALTGSGERLPLPYRFESWARVS